MVVGLVDTSIIVDLIRGFPDAHEWLRTQTDEIGLTHYVWLEIIQGATSKNKQKSAIAILSDFKLVESTAEDTEWAVKSLMKVKLAHNVDAIDSLIAASSYRLQIPLYTRNLKHFEPLLGKLAQKPY